MNPKEKFINSIIPSGGSQSWMKKKTPVISSTSANISLTPGQFGGATTPNSNPTSNPGATTPPKNNLVTPPAAPLSDAGKKFADNLYASSNSTTPTSSNSSTSTPSTPPPSGNPTSTPTPENPYLKYLNSLFNPREARTAQENIQGLNERISSELLRTREREDELKANKVGQLERGQAYQLGEEERLSNRTLADLAIAKGSATDILNQITTAGKDAYDIETKQAEKNEPVNVGGVLYQKQSDGTYKALTGAEKEAFNLGQGQARYEINPTTGKYERVAYNPETYAPSSSGAGSVGSGGGFSGTLSPLAQAVQNGTITIDKIPAADRARVAAELATSGIQTGRQQTLSSSLDAVNNLLNNTALSQITGLQNPFTVFTPGTQAQLAKNQYNQLKGILSLENREKLKGSGAISDFEFKVLSDAATALGRNLSDKDFRAQLEKIRDVFEGKYAITNALNGSSQSTPPTGGGDPLGIR